MQIDLGKVAKVSFVNLGCPKNIVDSEVMLAKLVESGFYLCEDYADSDIIIINTCSFLKEAEAESTDLINQAIELKQKGYIKKIVVAGCLPQRYIKSLDKFHQVDALIGVTQRDKIADVCHNLLSDEKRVTLVDDDFSPYETDRNRLRITPKHYAYLKIAEGCNHSCSFCIIPNIKGRLRSKPINEVMDEAKELADDGVKELILIAQDTTEYGMDLYQKPMLFRLLDELSRLEQIRWIRLLYCHPIMINNQLIKTIAENPKVVKYIDLPIQHIKERILRLMQRGITEKAQKEIIYKLREDIKDLFIRVTIIVGFPSERREEFDAMLKEIEELRFERLACFKFSSEPETSAHEIPGKIPEDEIQKRYNELMLLQKDIVKKLNRSLLDKKMDVIIDEKLRNNRYIGRTYADAPEIDTTIEVKGSDIKVGSIIKAKIIGIKDYDLVGILS